MIGVLTDSTASIPEELVQELGIEIVPYYVHREVPSEKAGETPAERRESPPGPAEAAQDDASDLPSSYRQRIDALLPLSTDLKHHLEAIGSRLPRLPSLPHGEIETLRDMVDIKTGEFAEWLKGATKLPTTSNPGPGDYITGLTHLAERVKEIIALTMTSKGSGAYQSCQAAVGMFKEQLPEVRVEVVDTLQVAMSHGWAAIEAARAALANLSFDEVVRRAREVARKGMMIQTADTLRYLYMGGRIGKAKHLAGSLLNIKPLIGMQDGIIVAFGTARSRLKAYRRMVELMQQRVGEGARIKVAFTHVAALDQLEILRPLVTARFECIETIVTELSPALAVHTGPGTVGLSFFPT